MKEKKKISTYYENWSNKSITHSNEMIWKKKIHSWNGRKYRLNKKKPNLGKNRGEGGSTGMQT